MGKCFKFEKEEHRQRGENVGFMEDTTVEQRNKIQKHLTDKYEQKQSLFEETDAIVKKYVDQLWQRIPDTKRLDIIS